MNTKFPLIVANWKMHKTLDETKEYFKDLIATLPHSSAWFAVPYTFIASASESVKGFCYEIGAQNMSDRIASALTGEISAPMLVSTGATFVILGHSERRTLFHEDNSLINRKIKSALSSNLKVILCIGESLDERDANLTNSILQKQLKECLESLDSLDNIIIAYEPLWAIGTNQVPAIETLEEIHQLCKNWLATDFGLTPDKVKVLYGGSINVSNAHLFLSSPSVDGLLVGGASLDVQSFAQIIKEGES